MNMYWKLGGPDGHTPEPATRDEFSHMYNDPLVRRVAEDEFDGIRVSTVFLGLDHSFGGPPILFETMTFGGAFNEDTDRYCTWEEAEAGHRRALALAHTANDLHIKEPA